MKEDQPLSKLVKDRFKFGWTWRLKIGFNSNLHISVCFSHYKPNSETAWDNTFASFQNWCRNHFCSRPSKVRRGFGKKSDWSFLSNLLKRQQWWLTTNDGDDTMTRLWHVFRWSKQCSLSELAYEGKSRYAFWAIKILEDVLVTVTVALHKRHPTGHQLLAHVRRVGLFLLIQYRLRLIAENPDPTWAPSSCWKGCLGKSNRCQKSFPASVKLGLPFI
jgi:hypothetical protein